jgi:hypothetical protein
LASQTFAGSKTFSSDITVNSLTVGRGGGAVFSNTALGLNALGNNTTGGYSIGIGPSALFNNVGTDNIAIGNQSQQAANTSSSHNYSMGSESLRSNTSGSSNISFGFQNSYSNTTGSGNMAIGTSSFFYNTTGSYNTALGSNALATNVGGTYNVGIGYYANVGSANLYNVVAIGASAVGYTSNTIQMGDSNITQMNTSGTIGVGRYSSDSAASGITGSIYYNTSSAALKVYSGTAWLTITSSSSDYRIKDNIENLDLNIYNTQKFRPVTYTNKAKNKKEIGFIAHEVQEYYPFLVDGEKDGQQTQSLDYISIIGILVKEIQELKQRVKQLEDDSKNK